MKIISLFLLAAASLMLSGCLGHYVQHDSHKHYRAHSPPIHISPQIKYRVIKREVYWHNYSTSNPRSKHYRGSHNTPSKHYRNDRKKRTDNWKKRREDRKWDREMDRTFRYRR